MRGKVVLIWMLLLCVSSSGVWAQKKKTYTPPKIEDLPRHPIDTVQGGDKETKIILYSNNTWSYYRPEMTRSVENLYNEHWVTESVFAYKGIELSDMPSKVELKMVETSTDFHAPIVGKVFSPYGPRRGRNHNGVDIPLSMHEPIYATFDGKIRYAKYNTGGFGNLVIIRHANGLETWSAHLSRTNVQSGDVVKAGQIIGFGGSTGRSRGPHLHFEIRYCDQTFDPEFILDFETGSLKYHTFVLEKSFFNIHSRATEMLDEDEADFSLPMVANNEAALPDDGDGSSTVKKTAPKTAPKTTGTKVTHTVRSGDTLSKIAGKYGVSIDQICRLNNVTRSTVLQLGRKLTVK